MILGIMLFAGNAHAVLVGVNDSFDEQGTYLTDINSGLDWLDVTATAGRSYNDVYAATQDSNDALYDWRYATADEVNGLVSNWLGLATPITTYDQVVQPEGGIDDLVQMLGSTLDSYYVTLSNSNISLGTTFDASRGYAEGELLDYTRGMVADGGVNTDGTTWHYTAWLYDNDGYGSEPYLDSTTTHSSTRLDDFNSLLFGSFLVRDTSYMPPPPPPTAQVPAPASLFLVAVGLIGLVSFRRKN
jgi:hypothetical protein